MTALFAAESDFDPQHEFILQEWIPIHIGPLDMSVNKAVAYLWLGGLLTIVALRPLLGGARLLPVLGRYSSLALVSFIVVAASGYISAELRLATRNHGLPLEALA